MMANDLRNKSAAGSLQSTMDKGMTGEEKDKRKK
jgi:hypothetical protein